MSERRRLGDQAGEALDVLSQRPTKRDRKWEEEQRDKGIVVTYRGVPREVQERLKEIAKEAKVTVGELARYFLEHGIADYEAGSLVLEPEDKATTKKTLYPKE